MGLFDDIGNVFEGAVKSVGDVLETGQEFVGGTLKRAKDDPFGAALTFGIKPQVEQALGMALGGKTEAPGAPPVDLSGLQEDEKRRVEAIQKRLEGNIGKEEDLRRQVETQRMAREQALENELQRRMQEIGIAGQEQRQDVGEAASQRGILRSSFAQSQFEKQRLGEQQQTGIARAQAATGTEQAREAQRRVEQQIGERRERLQAQIEFGRLQDIENELLALDSTRIRQSFESELAQLELDTQRRGAILQGVGGIAQLGAYLAFA